MPQERSESPKDKNSPTALKKLGVGVLMLATILLVSWFIAGATTDGGGADAADFDARVDSITALNPAEARVELSVANNGTAAGAPSCFVRVESDGGQYKGSDIRTGETIQPGASERYSMIITVEKEGAAHVTRGTAECDSK